jgi:hypothetical protein
VSEYEQAWMQNGLVYEQLFQLAETLDPIQDKRANREVARMRAASERLNAYVRLRIHEEQTVRGLGDPAVTGSAPGGPTEPSAGEPVGRGRVKTRLRT